MHKFKWFLILTAGLLLSSSQCIAEIVVHFPSSTTSEKATDNTSASFMLFQVIKDQMVLDYSNIKSATLIEPQAGDFKGLLIELKPAAVSEIAGLTSAGLGKPANLIFNKKVISTSVIQTPLGGSVLISGISKEDAQLFLKTLNDKKRTS